MRMIGCTLNFEMFDYMTWRNEMSLRLDYKKCTWKWNSFFKNYSADFIMLWKIILTRFSLSFKSWKPKCLLWCRWWEFHFKNKDRPLKKKLYDIIYLLLSFSIVQKKTARRFENELKKYFGGTSRKKTVCYNISKTLRRFKISFCYNILFNRFSFSQLTMVFRS